MISTFPAPPKDEIAQDLLFTERTLIRELRSMQRITEAVLLPNHLVQRGFSDAVDRIIELHIEFESQIAEWPASGILSENILGLLLRWPEMCDQAYNKFISSFQMGLDEKVASMQHMSDDKRLLIERVLQENESEGRPIDLDYLFKRPLVRLRYYSKLYKYWMHFPPCPPSLSTSDFVDTLFLCHDSFHSLVIIARSIVSEQKAELVRQKTFKQQSFSSLPELIASFDYSRVRDIYTLKPKFVEQGQLQRDPNRKILRYEKCRLNLLHSSTGEVLQLPIILAILTDFVLIIGTDPGPPYLVFQPLYGGILSLLSPEGPHDVAFELGVGGRERLRLTPLHSDARSDLMKDLRACRAAALGEQQQSQNLPPVFNDVEIMKEAMASLALVDQMPLLPPPPTGLPPIPQKSETLGRTSPIPAKLPITADRNMNTRSFTTPQQIRQPQQYVDTDEDAEEFPFRSRRRSPVRSNTVNRTSDERATFHLPPIPHVSSDNSIASASRPLSQQSPEQFNRFSNLPLPPTMDDGPTGGSSSDHDSTPSPEDHRQYNQVIEIESERPSLLSDQPLYSVREVSPKRQNRISRQAPSTRSSEGASDVRASGSPSRYGRVSPSRSSGMVSPTKSRSPSPSRSINPPSEQMPHIPARPTTPTKFPQLPAFEFSNSPLAAGISRRSPPQKSSPLRNDTSPSRSPEHRPISLRDEGPSLSSDPVRSSAGLFGTPSVVPAPPAHFPSLPPSSPTRSGRSSPTHPKRYSSSSLGRNIFYTGVCGVFFWRQGQWNRMVEEDCQVSIKFSTDTTTSITGVPQGFLEILDGSNILLYTEIMNNSTIRRDGPEEVSVGCDVGPRKEYYMFRPKSNAETDAIQNALTQAKYAALGPPTTRGPHKDSSLFTRASSFASSSSSLGSTMSTISVPFSYNSMLQSGNTGGSPSLPPVPSIPQQLEDLGAQDQSVFGTITLVKDHKIKVFLRQEAGMWKNMGSAKVSISSSGKSGSARAANVEKRVIVTAGKKDKDVVVDGTLTEHACERVGKTGVAVNLPDKAGKIVVYMLQVKPLLFCSV